MLEGFGLAPVVLELDLDSYDGPWTHVHRFRNRSGWLTVAEALLESRGDRLRTTLVAACDEWGQAVPGFMAPNLFACACSHPRPCLEEPPDALDDILCEEEGALIVRWQRETNRDLGALADGVERRVVLMEAATRRFIDAGERQIAELRRRRRMPGLTLDAQSVFDTVIADIDAENDAAIERLAVRRARLRADAEHAEDVLLARLAVAVEVTPLYTVQWVGSGMGRGTELRHILNGDDIASAWRTPPSDAAWRAECRRRAVIEAWRAAEARAAREVEERRLASIAARRAAWIAKQAAKRARNLATAA